MKLIEFLQRVAPYQKGEIAGFDDADADRMIAAKHAREVSKKTNKKADPKKPSDNKSDGGDGSAGSPGDGGGAGGGEDTGAGADSVAGDGAKT